MKLSENALRVLQKRILQKNETPEAMFRRVARHVASVEENIDYWADQFFYMMSGLDFLPNSPTLRNAGANKGNLSACFVIPIDDSRKAIFKALQDAVEVQAFGGGTGYDFSPLRPRNSLISTTRGKASGPVGFMRVFDFVIGEIIAQGGVRKGAQMGILSCNHPDIIEFIHCKDKEGELRHFNISVALTDWFMQNLQSLKPIGNTTGSNATIWATIIQGAWQNGEPGIVFLDTINKANPLRDFQIITATNPCGEQPLAPYESCVLGSINLSNFVAVPTQLGTVVVQPEFNKPSINYGKLKDVVQTAVRFLDNIIEVNNYPIPEIKLETEKFRKIGLGVMGWADLLIKLKIVYGSDDSLVLAEKIMQFIQEVAHEYSEELGREKGDCVLGRRNGTLTTIAPTGTLSLIAGCSSGIEPVFAFEFTKKAIDDTLIVMHPLWEKCVYNFPADACKNYWVEAKDVSIEQHVRMQAAFQKYTDNAVSKTINAPNSATVEDVDKAFRLAYELGCKGITFYRQGSREDEAQAAVMEQKLRHEATELKKDFPVAYGYEKEYKEMGQKYYSLATETPEFLEGSRDRIKTGDGTLWVHLFEDPNSGFKEMWTQISKSGRTMAAMNDAIGRLGTLALKKGASWAEIEKQLRGIGGERVMYHNGEQVLSPPDGIAKVIRKRKLGWRSSTVEHRPCKSEVAGSIPVVSPMCPDCGEIMEIKEGCSTCPWCGWSNCG